MSLIWSIIIGFVLSIIFKSGWAFLIGLFVGPTLYNLFCKKTTTSRTKINPNVFLIVLFETLGHISKAKGVVTQEDIHLANQVMDQLQLQDEYRQLAQSSFNRGKANNYPLRSRLQAVYQEYRLRRDVLNVFCEQIIQAALVDGNLHEKEQQILFIIAHEFHIPQQQMIAYIQMMIGSYHFRQQANYQSYSNRGSYSNNKGSYNSQSNNYRSNNNNSNSYNNSRSNSYGSYSSGSNLQNAYRVLGVSETTEVVIIKRAYRKLMNEHHPDKLASKGLPKEMLETAKRRAQEIQIAYDLIKASRGFK